MVNNVRTYILTHSVKKRIVAKKLKWLNENATMKGALGRNGNKPFGIRDGEVVCRQCKQKILLGSKVISKPFGQGHRIYYHETCAKQLNII